MSLRSDIRSPAITHRAASKASGPTPTKRRNSTLWSETLDVHQKSTFSTKEIKRQEVVKISAFKCQEKGGFKQTYSKFIVFHSRQFTNSSGESRISSRIFSWHERLDIFIGDSFWEIHRRFSVCWCFAALFPPFRRTMIQCWSSPSWQRRSWLTYSVIWMLTSPYMSVSRRYTTP